MRRYTQAKPKYPQYADDEDVYEAKTQYVKDKRDNFISRGQIMDQLANSPPPRSNTLSGYPHKFENADKMTGQVQIEELKIAKRVSPAGSVVSGVSSTTSHFEYPVHGDGHLFDYNTKKKFTTGSGPENLRAITNQKGRFKGLLAHTGEPPPRGASGGDLEWVSVREKPTSKSSKKDRK